MRRRRQDPKLQVQHQFFPLPPTLSPGVSLTRRPRAEGEPVPWGTHPHHPHHRLQAPSSLWRDLPFPTLIPGVSRWAGPPATCRGGHMTWVWPIRTSHSPWSQRLVLRWAHDLGQAREIPSWALDPQKRQAYTKGRLRYCTAENVN